MAKKHIWLIIGILLLSGAISLAGAENADNESGVLSKAGSDPFAYVCNQPYALCNTAFCVPDQNDPTKMRCSCTVENGTSMGGDNCSEWEPVGMYMNEYGEWMIKAGYSVGQVVSTYSFAYAAPLEGNEINKDNIPADYTGDVYLKSCVNESGEGKWADCWNAPCTVLPEDINADINTDRKASSYAVCDCGLKLNQSDWYIAVHGTEKCDNPDLCNEYVISGASTNTMEPGRMKLTKSLKENEDPTEPYKEGYCENCTDCVSNASA